MSYQERAKRLLLDTPGAASVGLVNDVALMIQRSEKEGAVEILLAKIEPNTFNPNVMPKEEFEHLKEGMTATGVAHDLAVDSIIVAQKNVFYKDPTADPDSYVVIDGYHRWKAALEIGWDSIPCRIRDVSEDVAKALNYRKNKERGSLDPLLEAKLFKSEKDAGMKQEEIASKYNVSRPYIANRLSLIRIEPTVADMYRKPEETLEEVKLADYAARVKEWNEAMDKAQKEDENFDPDDHYWSRNEPEKPEDFVPRGTLSASHLEPLATLPKNEQPEMAMGVLESGWTVRETERRVKRRKEEIATEKRFKKALKKAKRPKCPTCGADPKSFSYSNENKFSCETPGCYNTWDYMKTRKEIEAERKAESSVEKQEMRDRFKEARQNPRYIRVKRTPSELDERVRPWILRKVHELTEVESVNIVGKRGDETIDIDYTPPGGRGGYSRMDLSLKIGDQRFGFNVQEKAYKKFDAKARVDLGWGLEPCEENREKLRKFFDETVETSEDPLMPEPRVTEVAEYTSADEE